MKCPECQFDNREGAKFCKECGNKLELACPKCGNIYTPESKFCDECGHNLTSPSEPSPRDLSLDEKLVKIQRYLPRTTFAGVPGFNISRVQLGSLRY